MRTTLTVDDDVARELQARARRSGKTFKEVVNDALRRGLRLEGTVAELAPYEVNTFSSALLPGIDPTKLNQLFDELETADDLAELNAPDAVRKRKR